MFLRKISYIGAKKSLKWKTNDRNSKCNFKAWKSRHFLFKTAEWTHQRKHQRKHIEHWGCSRTSDCAPWIEPFTDTLRLQFKTRSPKLDQRLEPLLGLMIRGQHEVRARICSASYVSNGFRAATGVMVPDCILAEHFRLVTASRVAFKAPPVLLWPRLRLGDRSGPIIPSPLKAAQHTAMLQRSDRVKLVSQTRERDRRSLPTVAMVSFRSISALPSLHPDKKNVEAPCWPLRELWMHQGFGYKS